MRSTMPIIGLAFLFLTMSVPFTPSAFGAENWILIDQNNDSGFFYDRDSKSVPTVGVVRVTTRVIYTDQGKVEALKTLGTVQESEELYETRYIYDIDCEEREARLLASTHLDKSGGILKSTDLGIFTEWEYLLPQTRMALVAQEACGQ